MENITQSTKGNKIIFEIDLPPKGSGTLSASGKSKTIASTRGNQSLTIGDRVISFGINVYEKV